jgi:hypothetical protein
VREGRQGGSEALFEDVAGVARVGYDRAGISVAASVFSGETSQGARTPGGQSFGGRTTIYEAHVDMRHRGVRFRALAAGANVDDTADINAANGLTGDGGGASVGSRMWGAYAEAGYELWSRLHPGSRFELIPFARYEALDTQAEVPSGFVSDGANADQIATAGLAFYPHPQVVLKADYQWLRNDSKTGTNQWNGVLGFLF